MIATIRARTPEIRRPPPAIATGLHRRVQVTRTGHRRHLVIVMGHHHPRVTAMERRRLQVIGTVRLRALGTVTVALRRRATATAAAVATGTADPPPVAIVTGHHLRVIDMAARRQPPKTGIPRVAIATAALLRPATEVVVAAVTVTAAHHPPPAIGTAQHRQSAVSTTAARIPRDVTTIAVVSVTPAAPTLAVITAGPHPAAAEAAGMAVAVGAPAATLLAARWVRSSWS
jgi:hypothetical protein